MAVIGPPEYPKSLTDTDWQKKKGIFAKLRAGKTGIGEELKKIKKLFDEVDWSKFYAKILCVKEKGVVLPSQAKALKDAMWKEFEAKCGKIRDELKKFQVLAKKVSDDFKNDTKIPKSSREHVEGMIKTADHFEVGLRKNGVYLTDVGKEFDDEIARLQRLQDIAKRTIEEGLKNLLQDAKGVKETPNIATFTGGAGKGFYQRIRTVNASLAQLKSIDAFEKFRAGTWVKFSQASYLPTKDDQVMPKVKEVLVASKTLGGLIAQNL